MKVNPNRDLKAAVPISPATRPAARPSAPAKTDFDASTQLAQKLAATPKVRADQVARAQVLIADPNYPDAKTVRQIARRLADKIQPPNSAE